MGDAVTLKAVRDELAALGHDLSEDVVASLLEDAGAAELLNSIEATSNPAYDRLETTGHSPVVEAYVQGFGPGATVYVNQIVSEGQELRGSDAKETLQYAENHGGEESGYESDTDPHKRSSPDEWGCHPTEAVLRQECESSSLASGQWVAPHEREDGLAANQTSEVPFGMAKLAELWDTVYAERPVDEHTHIPQARPCTARAGGSLRPGHSLYSPNSTGQGRPKSSMSWTRVPTLNRSYIVPALAPPRRSYSIDRVARYKQMQQLWESDPFLQAGAGGAKGRRAVPDYRRAFAACHEAEDRTRREYLQMRSHRQMPIMEAPTLKRRDSLMWEQRQQMQLQDFP